MRGRCSANLISSHHIYDLNVDHAQFYVGNAKHAMYYWWQAFGFEPVAYSGLKTGSRKHAPYMLESENFRFAVSAPDGLSHAIAGRYALHGDGVNVISLKVGDIAQAFKATPSTWSADTASIILGFSSSTTLIPS